MTLERKIFHKLGRRNHSNSGVLDILTSVYSYG